MKIGIMGVGVVGGVLRSWLEQRTKHELKLYDPPRGYYDSLKDCEHIFISVPVPAKGKGQDLTILKECVLRAKQFTHNVYIRSTVLPCTNDELGTIAMPEFLTERRAFEDFCELPILLGERAAQTNIKELFWGKEIIFLSNVEAELTKFTHNCFGAMKVSYFNIIEELCRKLNGDYSKVVAGSLITGFVEPTHTLVPGPDGKRGFGGKCFPENINAMQNFLSDAGLDMESARIFFEAINILNLKYRNEERPQLKMHGLDL